MSSELATIQAAPLAAGFTFQEIGQMGVALAKSGLFGCKSPEQAVALLLLAQSEGLHPMRAIQEYDIIQGRPALKPAAMLARFQRDGGKVKYIERTPTRCVIEFTH